MRNSLVCCVGAILIFVSVTASALECKGLGGNLNCKIISADHLAGCYQLTPEDFQIRATKKGYDEWSSAKLIALDGFTSSGGGGSPHPCSNAQNGMFDGATLQLKGYGNSYEAIVQFPNGNLAADVGLTAVKDGDSTVWLQGGPFDYGTARNLTLYIYLRERELSNHTLPKYVYAVALDPSDASCNMDIPDLKSSKPTVVYEKACPAPGESKSVEKSGKGGPDRVYTGSETGVGGGGEGN